ncbi:MAG: hypothetical protein ABIC82_04335 [bacterium]
MRQLKTIQDKMVPVILISILVFIIGIKLLLIYKESRKPHLETINLKPPITRAVKIEQDNEIFKEWRFDKTAKEAGVLRMPDKNQFLSFAPIPANIYYTEKLKNGYFFTREYRSKGNIGLISFEESDYFLSLLDKKVVELKDGKIYFEAPSPGDVNKGILGIMLLIIGAGGILIGLSAGKSNWLIK